MMLKAMSAAILLTFSLGAFSEGNLEGFKKRFTIVKDDAGSVEFVKMNLVTNKFSIIPYVRQVKNDIQKEVRRMNSKSFDTELEALFSSMEQGSNKTVEFDENITKLRDSFKVLKKTDIESFFNKVETKGVLSKFQQDLQSAFSKYSLATIVSTQDPRYFYKRNVTYEVVKKALEFAKKKFDSVPLLNLASFVIIEVHDMLLEQRLTHQNMLLFYLENVSEKELGITVKDADKMFSSIYESRISAMNYRESSNAAANWTSYGLDKFYMMVRTANNKLRRVASTFDDVPYRVNYGFITATEGGVKVIKNLIHTKHSFSSEMAVAYNYSKPDQVRRFRSLLNLGQVGLGFLTLPAWLKEQVESFVKSYYVEQKILEGSLIGYFEYTGNTLMAKNVKEQMINPYFQY